jgi:hypothetical protein
MNIPMYTVVKEQHREFHMLNMLNMNNGNL